jgi:uracil-DNA glycosylase family 4
VRKPKSHAFDPVKIAARKLGAKCYSCPCLKEGIPVGPAPIVAGRKLRLIAIGEGPGQREEQEGRPFIGKSGQLFDSLLSKNKLLRSETHVTNGSICRAETDRDKKRAAHCCAPRLLAELALLPANVPIVTMGAFSTKAILGMGNITLIRGFIWKVPPIDEKEIAKAKREPLKHPLRTVRRAEAQIKTDILLGRAALAGRVVLPTLHPAHILRQEVLGPLLKIDFKRVARVVRGEVNLDKLADKGKHIATTDIRKLRALGREISLDVETDTVPSPLLATLLCTGMSDGIRTIILWPWNKRLAKPLGRFLSTREAVVCHNLSFDRAVLENHGVK